MQRHYYVTIHQPQHIVLLVSVHFVVEIQGNPPITNQICILKQELLGYQKLHVP